jgi:electron transport complex protein RnfC
MIYLQVWTFKGGVHPPTKKLGKDSPIKKVHLPERVSLFVGQNLGKPPKLLVEVGQEVKTGQLIAQADGFVSANLHSPVTGKVVEITKKKHPVTSRPADVVIIERSGEDIWEKLEPAKPYDEFTKEEIVKRAQEAGLVGMGGATFPTHVKLSPTKEVDTLIINGAECEPYLTIDDRMMREYPEEIVRGVLALSKALQVNNVYIGIEENKPEAIKSIKEIASKHNIHVAKLKTKYPQGSEKHLIYAITHRKVPAGGLPMDVGVVVQNVSTARAMYRALEYGEPLIERGVSVTGEGVENPQNLFVRLGTPISELLKIAGLKEDAYRLILGGPMMGIAVDDDGIGVMKGTSGITVLTSDIVKKGTEMNCIKCGRCVKACPMNLEPYLLYKLFKKKKFNDMAEHHLMDCIECGSCAYVCPSNIDHVKAFKTAKTVVRALGRR